MMRFVLPTVLALLAATAPGADAEPLQLTVTGQFQVQWKGAIEPTAKVYHSSGAAVAFLVTTAAFTRPVYITIGPTTARLLDPTHVSHDPANADSVRVDPSGAIENILGLKADGPNLTLDRDGISITLIPSPPVLGDRTLDELTHELPDYRRDAGTYAPNASAIEKLQRLQQPAEITVFFGSWCSHCAQLVPRLVRTLQDAKSSHLKVTFHGLPTGGAADPVADDAHISALPTAIIRRDGKQEARMTDADWDTPEMTLAKLLTEKPAK